MVVANSDHARLAELERAIQQDRMPEPPDLQKLIELRGGHEKITAEDWVRYDRQWELATAWLASRHKVGGVLTKHKGDDYRER
jgi:hypothetical protein